MTPHEATLDWNGTRVDDGTSLVPVPLEGGSGMLRVDAPGYVAFERRVTLLDGPRLVVDLEKKASATPEPHHAPTPAPASNLVLPPVTPTRAPTPAATPHPRIRIAAADPEDADATPGADAPPPPKPAAPERFSVRDASEAEITRAIGEKTIIDPTPGFFDYLKPEVTQRFRLVVEIVTVVRGKQVFFDGVKLHLTDAALNKPIPTKFIELDKPLERPLRGLEGGGKKVEDLTRALHIKPPQLQENLTDELRSMISDFNRREQDAQR